MDRSMWKMIEVVAVLVGLVASIIVILQTARRAWRWRLRRAFRSRRIREHATSWPGSTLGLQDLTPPLPPPPAPPPPPPFVFVDEAPPQRSSLAWRSRQSPISDGMAGARVIPHPDSLPREPGESEEAYEMLRTYASLSIEEREDLTLVHWAHHARCTATIQSAGLDDANFQELCEQARGEGVTAVDLRGPAIPRRDQLPENCALAVRIDGGVLIGPSWAVCWMLRMSGLYIAA